LDAEEELGITGHIEFIELTAYARKKLVDGDQLVVKAVNGNVLHMGNDRPLSKNARPSLPNGTYLMNHMGIIRVSDAVPELKSNYLTRTVAQRESGFTFDADPTVSRSTVSASR
jgi:hypothetical protein